MLYSFDPDHLKELPKVTVGEATDEQLMERIQHGDEAALAALYQRHCTLIRTIISRMIANDHDVDELVQDCLLEIWRHAANYSVEKGQALGWIEIGRASWRE